MIQQNNKINNLNRKFKARETKYRNLGCEILQGDDALKAIQKSYSLSMIAIDTDNFYSIEYSGNSYFYSDLEDEDFYTVRKIVDNKVKREVYWGFMLPDISVYKWAIKEYHTGIRLAHPYDG